MKPFQFHPACVTRPFVWAPTSVCLCFIITFVQVCSVFYCVLFRFESHVFLPEGKNLWNLFLCPPEHIRQSGLYGRCQAQWKSLFRGGPACASRLLGISDVLSTLFLLTGLWVTGMIMIHFTDEKTEVQKGDVTCSESVADEQKGRHLHSGLPNSKAHFLCTRRLRNTLEVPGSSQ